MPNNNQGLYPGEEDHYNQAKKLNTQPPKRPNVMVIVVCVLVALVIILGTTTFLALRQIKVVPSVTVLPTATSQPSNTIPTLTPTPATIPTPTPTQDDTNDVTPTATASTGSVVPTGTVTENLLLSCGANCNDPIRVTITTVQVDDANGRMIWNISLKNVTGGSIFYNVDTFELVPEGAQTQIPATISQVNGNLPNSDPTVIQANFAFAPIKNTTYVLTVVVHDYETNVNFDPVQITNL